MRVPPARRRLGLRGLQVRVKIGNLPALCTGYAQQGSETSNCTGYAQQGKEQAHAALCSMLIAV